MAGGGPGRLTAALTRVRARWPVLDRLLRTQQLYSSRNGSVQAGGVTYFAFLSFFPVLAIAFFVVGYVARVWPGAEDGLTTGIEQVLPGLVGPGEGQLSLETIRANAGTAGLVGVAGLLYAGLGWLSALRGALLAVFEHPGDAHPNFLVGKLRDLLTLAVLGGILLAGVAVSSLVTGFSEQALDWLGLGAGSAWALVALGLAFGVATNTLLLFAMFTLLARPPLLRRDLWGGALLGGVTYEVLKTASTALLQATREQPAAQVFGVALVVVVWMYYFSRLVLYAAAWASTASGGQEPEEAPQPVARQGRPTPVAATAPASSAPASPAPASSAVTRESPGRRGPGRLPTFAGGLALGAAAALAAVRRTRRPGG